MDGELNPNLSERINRLRPDGLSRWLLLVPSAVLVALFALPLAAIFLKERVTRRALIGTVLAFVGVVLCTRGIL